MNVPIQITFRNMEPSALAEQWIREQADTLEEFYKRIMGCRVAVEIPHRHRTKGNQYHIRIRLTVPGRELVVKWDPKLAKQVRQLRETEITKKSDLGATHKILQQAINDAFKVAGRRLEDYARRQRGDVKTHEGMPRGVVSRLAEDRSHGFLTAEDGREIYFHKDSVLNRAYGRLKVGANVAFAEEQGDKGPQASTVRVLRKHAAGGALAQAATLGK